MSTVARKQPESPDFVTILRCQPGKRATKLFRDDPHAKPEDYDAGKYFEPDEFQVTCLDDLREILDAIQGNPECFVIPGRLKPDVPRTDEDGDVLLYPKRKHNSDEGPAPFESAPHHWLCLDFDKTQATTLEELRAGLPEWLREAEGVWLPSAQAHRHETLRGKLFVWLDRPVGEAEARALCESAGADKSVMQAVQPIFIADPIFEGCADPFPSRAPVVVAGGVAVAPNVAHRSAVVPRQSHPAPTRAPGSRVDAVIRLVEDEYAAGRRHELVRALSGWLARFELGRWSDSEIEALFRALPSDRPAERVRVALETAARARTGEPTPGWDALVERVGAERARELEIAARSDWWARFIPKWEARDRSANTNRVVNGETADDDGEAPDVSEDQLKVGAELHRTDLGNARRLVLYFGEDLRYCEARRRWLIWDDSRWLWDDREIALKAAMALPDLIWREREFSPDSGEHAKHAVRSQNRQRIEAALALARAELAVAVGDLDHDPWALNVKNGTLDLRTGALREPCRDDLITKRAGAAFVPGARSDLWDSFVSTITMGDGELAAYIQRALGCALIGEYREKAFWIGYGVPDGGKSTFINAVASVFGDYHAAADAETWLTHNQTGANRGDLVRLLGTRLVTTSEFKRGVRFDPKTMKKVTGGDPLVAAAKYEGEIEFIAVFCLWFVANDAPAIDSDEPGMWVRARRVPFINAIPKNLQDRDLSRKLAAPEARSAILAWLVEGLAAYLRDGLGTCAAVEVSTTAYKAENDRFAEFLEDQCEFGNSAKHWVSTQGLAQYYLEWARRNKAREMGEREIGKRLSTDSRVAPKTRKVAGSNKRGWEGIAFVG